MVSVIIITPVIPSIDENSKYKNIKTDLTILNNVARFVSNIYLLII
jgi:hypothetical protein